MKFGAFVDLAEKLKTQKKFWKTPIIICGVMITLQMSFLLIMLQ